MKGKLGMTEWGAVKKGAQPEVPDSWGCGLFNDQMLAMNCPKK